MRRLLSSLACATFASTGALAADDKVSSPTLPPLATWQSTTGGQDTVLDFKNDKPTSVADEKMGRPPLKKEEPVPFIGLSITRPIGN